MTSAILLAIASFMLGVSISYAVWSKVRVVFLREELFTIRDHLWDVARKHEAFDDPAYVDAREHFNAAVVATPMCSVSILERVAGHVGGGVEFRRSDNEEFQAAIDCAYRQMTSLCLRYIFLWRASGWLHILKWNTITARRKLIRWLESSDPVELREYEVQRNRRHTAAA